MSSITKLRDDLMSVFHGLRDGTIDTKVATEMNNAAGKVINTVKVQLDYASLRKEIPRIPFMEEDDAA